MADLKIKYGTITTVTCTFGGLATATARISQAIDNTSTLAIDSMLHLTVGLDTGATTGNDNAVYVYFYGSVNDVRYTDNATGVDSAFGALRATNNLKGPYTVNFATATGGPIVYVTIPSVASYFGGIIPKKWGFIVQNKTNAKLVSTATAATVPTACYTPIFMQSV